MATSDAPLSVPNVTLAVARAQSGGGGNSINITGTISEGSAVSLSPASGGFGSFGGEVVQFAKGNEGVNGAAIEGSATALGGITSLSTFIIGMGEDTAGEHLLFSNANVRPGRSMSMRRRSNNGGQNRNGGFGYASGRSDPTLFISYWRYSASGAYSLSTINWKDYYAFGNGTGPSGQPSVPQPILHVPAQQSSYAMGANLSGSDGNVFSPWGLGSDTEDRWQRWDSLVTINTPGVADGVMKVWRDRSLGINDESFMWQPGNMQANCSGWKDFRLGYMDTNFGGALKDYTDMYVATSVARVEIGNASTWSACTHTEILPVIQADWSDQQINNVVLDKGGLPSLAESYLYVIKSDGLPFNSDGVAL